MPPGRASAMPRGASALGIRPITSSSGSAGCDSRSAIDTSLVRCAGSSGSGPPSHPGEALDGSAPSAPQTSRAGPAALSPRSLGPSVGSQGPGRSARTVRRLNSGGISTRGLQWPLPAHWQGARWPIRPGPERGRVAGGPLGGSTSGSFGHNSPCMHVPPSWDVVGRSRSVLGRGRAVALRPGTSSGPSRDVAAPSPLRPGRIRADPGRVRLVPGSRG